MIICCSAFIALVLAFIFMIFIKTSAGCVVWTFVILVVVGFFTIGGYFLNDYILSIGGYDDIWTELSEADFTGSSETHDLWNLYIGIIFIVFGFFSLIFICCCGRKLSIAIAVMKVSTSFLMENKAVLCIPLTFFVFVLLFLVGWVWSSIYLFSVATLSTEDNLLPFAQLIHSQEVEIMGYFYFFGMFWWVCFLMGASTFIIIGTVCYWYFNAERP